MYLQIVMRVDPTKKSRTKSAYRTKKGSTIPARAYEQLNDYAAGKPASKLWLVEPAHVESDDRTRTLRGSSDMGDNMMADTREEDNVDRAWNLLKPLARKDSAKKLREKAYENFNVQKHVKQIIESHDYLFLSQGSVGACFFMSLMNLLQFARLKKPTWFKKLGSKKGVENVYLTTLGLADDGYSSFRAVVQALPAKFTDEMSWEQLLSNFDYETFRHGSHDLWNKEIREAATTADNYDANVQRWLEHNLDQGCVVAIPFMQHFCCLIGYDTEHFLFLNSYGVCHDQGGLSPMLAYTKLEVASAINDCFYWTPGASSNSVESKENVGSTCTARPTRPTRPVYKTMVVATEAIRRRNSKTKNYRELQAIDKELNLPTNKKTAALKERIRTHLEQNPSKETPTKDGCSIM